jgi:hypothetical protein
LIQGFCARGTKQYYYYFAIYNNKGSQNLQSSKHIDTQEQTLCCLFIGEKTFITRYSLYNKVRLFHFYIGLHFAMYCFDFAMIYVMVYILTGLFLLLQFMFGTPLNQL